MNWPSPLVLKIIAVLVFVFVFCVTYMFRYSRKPTPSNAYHQEPMKKEKFVTFRYGASGIGNQMFRLVSGYSIARELGRKFCFAVRGKVLFDMLARITNAFPRTAEMFNVRIDASLRARNWAPTDTSLRIHYLVTVLKALKNDTPVDVSVTFADQNGKENCWKYDDPLRFRNHSAKYLLLDTYCAQNVRFFSKYLAEIRTMFRFSDAVRANMEHIVKCRQRYESLTRRFVNITCVHTRQKDFLKYNRTTDMDETVEAALRISQRHESEQFMVFGDDKNYNTRLANRLERAHGLQKKKAHLSTYDEFEEMYLSSQLCTSFLISNAMSTFGWWLAFFSKNQDSVYYTNDQRRPENTEGVQREDLFLSTWKKI